MIPAGAVRFSNAMSQFQSLAESLVILVALCGSAIWLRDRGTILRDEQGVFGRLVTDFALPAVILLSLSKVPFSLQALLPALLIFVVSVAIMVPAWIVGKAMGLQRKVLGSIILVASFGGSSTLGLSLIRRVFHDNPVVMRDSVLMGEYGVLLPVFTLGVAIAIYFGRDDHQETGLWEACRPFFLSPIFISMILGTAISMVGLPQSNVFVELVEDTLRVAGHSLMVLVAFSIGLALRPIAIRDLAALIAVAVLLKLVVEPCSRGRWRCLSNCRISNGNCSFFRPQCHRAPFPRFWQNVMAATARLPPPLSLPRR